MVKYMTFSERVKRGSGERSKTPATRSRSSRSASQKACQEAEQKQEHHQELGSFLEAHFRVSVKDFPIILRTIATIACIYTSYQTKDVSWVVTAFAFVTGSSNLPKRESPTPHS